MCSSLLPLKVLACKSALDVVDIAPRPYLSLPVGVKVVHIRFGDHLD